ncbi:hypothetical protein C7B89_01540 [Lysinibacillus capsici]|nr:hypothetical protein C7B89_01540 [Lysinibacillus capsici]
MTWNLSKFENNEIYQKKLNGIQSIFTLFIDYKNPIKIDEDFVWFNINNNISNKIIDKFNTSNKLIREFIDPDLEDLMNILFNSGAGDAGYDVSSALFIPFNFNFEINKSEITNQININGKEIILPKKLLNFECLQHDDAYLLAIMLTDAKNRLDSEGNFELNYDDLVMRKLFIKYFYKKIDNPKHDFIIFKLDNDYEKIFTSTQDMNIGFKAMKTSDGYNVMPNIKYLKYLS